LAISPDRKTLESLRIDRSQPRRAAWLGPLLLILLLFGLSAAAAAWWLNRPQPLAVRTISVERPSGAGSETTLLNASGYVVARRAATVSSKVTGKVVEVLVEEGMQVAEGQVVARLDSSNVEMSLKLAQAQLESARKALDETRANLEQAERELRRVTQLHNRRAASRSELDVAQTEALTTKARLDRQTADVTVSEREVEVWQQQLDDMTIRAPFNGVVTTKDSQPGEMISPISAGGGFTRTGICTIVDMSSLEIEVDVSESYINRVQPRQPVVATLDSYPDWQIPARVIAIVPTADRQKATVRVRVGFEELDPRILPEMSVKVAFQGTSNVSIGDSQIVLPRSAIRTIDDKTIVWLVEGDRLRRRAVSVASGDDERVALAAGLSGGERVVVEGPSDLSEGTMVREAER
jgi:RND family efflux transporter MFP subunit